MSTIEPSAPAPPATTGQPTAPGWHDQDGLLRDMWLRNQTPQAIASALGRSVPAVMTRAARLGLPRRSAPGRKPSVRTEQQTGDGGRAPPARAKTALRRDRASDFASRVPDVPEQI